MCPFKKITDWERSNFDAPKPEDVENRNTAVKETHNDLRKDIQQLLCDAHEEAQRGSLVGVNKRMTALLTITAYEARITSWWLKWLTVIIAVETLVLVYLAFCPRPSH